MSLIEYLQETCPKAILWVDIAEYTNNIDKPILNNKLKNIGVQKNIKAFNNTNQPLSGGIPGGNCLTPMLSNLYLIDLDMQYVDGCSRFSDDLFFL